MKIINIKKAKEEFIKFANNYDLENDHINRKKYHSLRVTEISEELAKRENFTEEEIEIATLIGLLHDIARFKQYTEYHTYRDADSIDHGNLGVEVLEENNYLRKYIQSDKYDNIIKLAVKNHNKFAIEEGLTDLENKFCKLIRDADKVDIIYETVYEFWKNEKEEMENSKITPELKKEFDQRKMLVTKNYKKIVYADKLIQFLGFVYDLNYKSSFKIITENNYIEQIINRFNFKDEYTQKQILDAGEHIKQYILNKIQE